MTTTKNRTTSLADYIDKLSLEMHTQQEWEDARDLDSLLGGIDFNEMLSNVFNKAYEQKPELFAGAQWINNEYGYPLWVRPGVDWVPDDDEEDDFF